MTPPELDLLDAVYLILIILVFVLLIRHISDRGGIDKNRNEFDEKLTSFKKLYDYEAKQVENIRKKCDWLQQSLNEKMKTLNEKMNEIDKKNNMVLEQKNLIMREVDNRVGPMKASVKESVGQMSTFQSNINKSMAENERELKRITKEFKKLSEEIKKMKDAIRERTIDFEL